MGAEILTWSINDEDTSHRADCKYFAIWKFPNNEVASLFQNAVSDAGWYQYFDQINIKGEQNNINNILQHLAAEETENSSVN